MDYIFESNPNILVAGKRDLTQRKRPQAFVDAEARRIEAGEKNEDVPHVLENAKGTAAVQVERTV